MTDDGCFDRAAVVERVTVATALPTGAVLAAATVLWAGDVAGALVVCATGAIEIATLLYLAEGLVSRPGRLGGLDGRPVAAGRDTTRRALPGLLAASLALAVLFAVVWGVSGSPSALVAALPLSVRASMRSSPPSCSGASSGGTTPSCSSTAAPRGRGAAAR